jgi:hypothetical protein
MRWHVPSSKLSLALTIALTPILSTIFASQTSAETTKQKRERLKAESPRETKPHEPWKSCFAVSYGEISSPTATINNEKFDSDDAEETWTGGLFFDSRVSNKFYIGPAIDVIGGTVLGMYDNSLYDASINLKLSLQTNSKFRLRPAVAWGYGMVPEKDGVKKVTFFSQKVYVEGIFAFGTRLGMMATAGSWWISGGNDVVDVSGHCLYGRLGLIFL